MNTIRHPASSRRNSLFVRLLGGFMLVIALLLSFNMLSFAFFQTNIEREIIDHNTLNMNNTVNGYEQQLQLVESDLLRFYFNERFSALVAANGQPNYTAVNAVKPELNSLLSNKMLFLENVFILFRDNPLVIERDTTTNAVNMFTKFYVSEPYGPVFWQNQFAEGYTFRVFPAADFRQYKYDRTVEDKGGLLPVVIKNKFSSQYLVAALLDADSMFRSLHYNGADHFYILDAGGAVLFHSDPGAKDASAMAGIGSALPADLPAAGDGYFIRDDRYYFYKNGPTSGLRYVNVIPNDRIASQVERLGMLLLGMLAVAVAASLLISVWLSIRFNSPVQGMIRLLQRPGQPGRMTSGIREFDWLGRSISDMLHANRGFDQDLRRKNKLLQNYGYMSKLKSIRHWNELHDLIETSKPFFLVAFQLSFTARFGQLAQDDQEKTAYYIQEYINLQMSGRFPGAVTLQMEKEQILSLLFTDEDASAVIDTLERLKQVLDRDKEYGFATMAFLPVKRSPNELSRAYEEAQAMLGSRLLNRDTQTITRLPAVELPALPPMSTAQEQELLAALLAGQDERAAELVDALLRHMELSGANARQFAELGKELVSHIWKLLLEHHYDISRLLDGESPFLLLKDCWSVDEYGRFFRRFAGEAAALVRERKAEQDPIRDFALDYVAKHYGEDISLELVAEKLGLSRGYLSTYFHEKTGQTFSEYVNGLRMQRAKEMLSGTDSRIQDIAAEVGYQNVNSFIRMFKRICGLTPGEFRRVALQQSGSETVVEG
ncbi:helix-turn-helix domain-containing protein [Paenibacillus hodogayensis]|uniref:Helix-turn-helix domain-containing protein n=1 Tax=Paenibacillus hodogayensis TaxID=279208 RepID=A0ABV5VZ37_9BACL